jgi:hypothetical protein
LEEQASIVGELEALGLASGPAPAPQPASRSSS